MQVAFCVETSGTERSRSSNNPWKPFRASLEFREKLGGGSFVIGVRSIHLHRNSLIMFWNRSPAKIDTESSREFSGAQTRNVSRFAGFVAAKGRLRIRSKASGRLFRGKRSEKCYDFKVEKCSSQNLRVFTSLNPGCAAGSALFASSFGSGEKKTKGKNDGG